VPDALQLPFFQRGLAEVLLLSVGAGILGTWIVLRGLAFFAHAVGSATFPGLVLADGLGFAAGLGAFGTALVVAALVALLARRRADGADAATALVLCAALALGVILASDVFGSQAGVDSLLFGSLLAIGGGDLALAAAASAAVLAASLLLGPRWLATGFDPGAARSAGARSALPDAVLLALVALTAVAVLAAVGSLLATALLVVPAATARLVTSRMRSWQLGSVALAAGEGVAGLFLSFETDAPPGATIAVLSGAVFALVAVARARGPLGAAAAASALLALGAAGCGTASGGGDDGRVRVVATTTQLADVARWVGGDAVDVTGLLQPGADPHDYEPRPSDVRAVAEADVVLASGLGLDRWIDGVARDAGADAPLLRLGDRVPHTVRTRGGTDPHWWHDPRNVQAAARLVAAQVARRAGSRRAAVQRRAAAYVARLRRLDGGIARCMAAVPDARRKLVTDHDAFATLAARYRIEVVGAVIPARTTQAQPSAGAVARLSRLIRRQRVRAVFPESSVNRRLARAIAGQTGAVVGAALYADTLGGPRTRGATYIGSTLANAEALVRGFTGGAGGCRIPGL
jgi:ABC-type Zn uptake system ZnuABC Zn-binding protein ZnuA/ABC-type Mn2+/Zn2+ transport system permease subunit